VILTAARVRPITVDDTDAEILATLADGEGHLTSEIATAIGLTSRATRTRLAKLVELGLGSEIGTGPQESHAATEGCTLDGLVGTAGVEPATSRL
jgi:DNA-binding Lrp family transcriptional regulator